MSRIYLSPPDVGHAERALLLDALESNWIAPLGPHVDAFEREFGECVRVTEAAAVSSGTAGLHLALVLLGVGPGDEVLVSDLTFVASANATRYVGALPVFVDCDATTWTIDPDLVEEALRQCDQKGRLPKALITVDLYGQCADYTRLTQLCKRYDVPIIQDACEALGATYRGAPAGGQGELSVFSFNGNKIITTSGGGMLVSDRPNLIERARKLASQARDPAAHYEHSELGYNYRMSNLLAALGRAQLRSLPERVERRRSIFEEYRRRLRGLPGWDFMPEASYGTSSRWLTCATIHADSGSTPESVRISLERNDIEARPLWKPMHLQPLYRECRCHGGSESERLYRSGICLPSGSSLTAAEQQRVIGIICDTVAGRGV